MFDDVNIQDPQSTMMRTLPRGYFDMFAEIGVESKIEVD